MRVAWLLVCSAVCLVACGGSGSGSGNGTGGWGQAPGAPALGSVLDVWAFSTTDVWFVDGKPAVQRFDGKSWSKIDTPSKSGLTCIFALSHSNVYLCSGSEVLHYDGSQFTASDVTGPTGLNGVSDVWASSPSDVWAVGDDAIIAHYDGTSWSRTIAGEPFKKSIWGSGPKDIYALDTFGLSHYDGSAWTDVSLDSGGGDGQVWGTSASDVWVMTDSSELGHFDGSTWKTVSTDLTGELAAVWGPAPNDLWGAGSAGLIAHYNGHSWRDVTHQRIGAPYLRRFVAVHGTSSSDVWAVGQQLGQGGSIGLIFHHAP